MRTWGVVGLFVLSLGFVSACGSDDGSGSGGSVDDAGTAAAGDTTGDGGDTTTTDDGGDAGTGDTTADGATTDGGDTTDDGGATTDDGGDTTDDGGAGDTTDDGGATTGADETGDTGGDGAPTWTNDVAPLFQANCSPCHSSSGVGGHNVASTYEDAAKPSNKCPGMTVGECSLSRILDGTMPPSSAFQGDSQIIQDWVDAGMPE